MCRWFVYGHDSLFPEAVLETSAFDARMAPKTWITVDFSEHFVSNSSLYSNGYMSCEWACLCSSGVDTCHGGLFVV